jgi:DNA-binding transcriptional regulator GbsR (MarR family)
MLGVLNSDLDEISRVLDISVSSISDILKKVFILVLVLKTK